ncbi:MAG: ribulose-phosphate 3-epimerase [Sphingobacteriales bacterium]|jgi:ribulose-phosphate 3-epimerase|nr:ribulose-phosphate 3-epimerase [Sphingobacteriales bacterium]MBP9141103.1 ribulose-phosphate 3-epimerase [Chitinophagales bacterium]MDA0197707.1 ribulose-phosphate 3-epimerase [Bacteroidota bacterium]MBK6888805.1 ribulose-phosphate 3-epimerase [Sphingobacteriales bacterium]MBK7528688.1 ribulose-phosphate 3-epimerase [Sphingobacteriales bacterium]
MPIVAPSILSANFANLAADIQLINQSQADWFHVDIMDGVFVPNISFGFPVLKALQKLATKPLDVHLMIVDPDRYINAFADCGASTLTVHYEACTHLHRSIQSIRKAGMRPGVAINPHTPANLLQYILPDIDLVCVMSVNPGFGGQTFIKSSLLKLNELKTMRQTLSANHVLLEVDGGVDFNNAQEILTAGADILVAGNTVFSAANPEQAIAQLKNL